VPAHGGGVDMTSGAQAAYIMRCEPEEFELN
jgi:hypothetical protein